MATVRKPDFISHLLLERAGQRRVNKSKTDDREYEHLQLANGLRVVVASDPDTSSSAAAALAVLVGSVHEPTETQGLAHFCEHMVLHGTLSPTFGGVPFAEYVKQHGGTHNAVTTMLQTCFAFEIQSDKLEGALSRFATFFVSPTFSRAHHEQEIKAIDSEHSMNTQNDFRRQWAILLLDVNPKHRYHWGSGCRKTFDFIKSRHVDLHRSLEAFHSTNYTANRMVLAVVGTQSTRDLAAWARRYFSAVPSSNLASPDPKSLLGDAISGSEPPFLPEDFRGQVFVEPVKNIRQFRLAWLIPWQVVHWRKKPTAYVIYLLGHQGQGGLLSVLKSRGLAAGVSASCFDYHGVASTLELTVDLTPGSTAESYLAELGELVFAYIAQLRSLGPQRWVLEEHAQLQQLEFDFQNDTSTYNLVQDLACNGHYYPAEHVLAADHLLYDHDTDACQKIMDSMTVKSARLWLIAKEYHSVCVSTEPWYGARFSKRKSIEPSLLTRWESVESTSWKSIVQKNGLGLPMPNRFLPSDLSLRALPPQPISPDPVEIKGNEFWYRAWLRQVTIRQQPKVAASIYFHCPFVAESCTNAALTLMLCQCVQEELRAECAFEARMAGAMYKLELADTGILLQLLGFRDKLTDLAAAVAEKLIVCSSRIGVPPATWAQVKDQQERSLSNASYSGQAYNQALAALEDLLLLPKPSSSQLLKALGTLDRQQLLGISSKLFGMGACLAEGLIVGNLDETEAKDLLEAVISHIRRPRSQSLAPVQHCMSTPDGTLIVPARSELILPKLPASTVLILDSQNRDDANSCVLESICNVARVTPENEALATVLMRVLKPMFFNELRTRQQLGYVVSSFVRTRVTSISLIFLVQTEKAPETARRSIHAFLQQAFKHVLYELTELEFSRQRESLARQLEEQPRNLWELLQRDWLPIEERTFAFNYRRQQAMFLRGCKLSMIRAFVRDHVQSAPRFAVVLRSPQASWNGTADHREQETRVLTKWALATYTKELSAEEANQVFGHVSPRDLENQIEQQKEKLLITQQHLEPHQSPFGSEATSHNLEDAPNDVTRDTHIEERYGADEEEEEQEEECKVQ